MAHFGRQSSDSSENHPENVEDPNEADIIPQFGGLGLNADRRHETIPCLACTRYFREESQYREHCRSEEHTIMTLITGIAIYEAVPEEATHFPSLYCCVLCNFFCEDFIMYESHLKDITHSEMTKFMRKTSFCKENIVCGFKGNEVPTFLLEFLNFLSCPPNYCKLCNKQCNGPINLEDHRKGQKHEKLKRTAVTCVFCNITFVDSDSYGLHLKTPGHIRVEDFMRKMILTEDEIMRTPKKHSYVPRYADASPRPSLYYCKLCNIEFNDVEYFRKHRSIALHRRVERLIRTMSIQLEVEEREDEIVEIIPRVHYCELCNVWCSRTTQRYEDHVKTGEHLLRKSKYNVHNWDCSPHKVLL